MHVLLARGDFLLQELQRHPPDLVARLRDRRQRHRGARREVIDTDAAPRLEAWSTRMTGTPLETVPIETSARRATSLMLGGVTRHLNSD